MYNLCEETSQINNSRAFISDMKFTLWHLWAVFVTTNNMDNIKDVSQTLRPITV